MNIQLESNLGGMLMVFLLLMGWLMVLGICIGQYVLRAWGTYKIAKRRVLRHAWLSWLPIGQDWMLGCVSDQYQYVVKGNIKNRRKVLTICSVATLVLCISIVGMYANILLQLLINVDMLDVWSTDELAQMFAGNFATIAALTGISYVVSIVYTIFVYIAVYDLYASCNPRRRVLYLIVSILLQILIPLFIFVNSKKDLGMPPRKDAVAKPEVQVSPAQQIQESPAPEVQETPAPEVQEIPAPEVQEIPAQQIQA